MPAVLRGRNLAETLNIALVGVGGRGADNHKTVAGQNIVALCDVDENHLGEAAKRALGQDLSRLPQDVRRASWPDRRRDRQHARSYACRDLQAALELGKHVYCEKPLTHSIHEARVLAETAARHKLATQMGNAGHSSEGTRRVVELIRAGAIGPVREVHAWTNRPIWPQAIDRPTDHPPVPSSLHWDLWLGPAPERPYHPAYHPFKWRGWWDFGTGALGDMGCHIIDAAFWALELREPRSIEAESPPISPHPETAPAWSIVRYEFRGSRKPAAGQAGLVRRWQASPARALRRPCSGEGLQRQSSSWARRAGCWSGGQGGRGYRLLPEREFAGYVEPKPTLPRSPGHHAEWIEACKTGKPTGTNFDYSAQLTELVLLGNVALRAGRRIEWDAAGSEDHQRFH